ncbi:MAG: HAMP domain-containing histidine kinase [Tissierellales bacterium]|jgi:signal transduction histidine kinase|nr:HAMP domain-containing histidine kinase [Tissierellales bacterium]
MKPKKIVIKLFITTISIFALLFFIQFIFQNIFMEKFYINSKIKAIKSSIESFSSDFVRSNWGFNQIKKEIDKFTEKNDASLIIVDDLGNDLYSNYAESTITLRDDSGNIKTFSLEEIYSIVDIHSSKYSSTLTDITPENADYFSINPIITDLSDASDSSNTITSLNLIEPKIGDFMELKYIEFDNNDESLYSLSYEGISYNDSDKIASLTSDNTFDLYPADYTLKEFSGEIIYVFIPNFDIINNYYQYDLLMMEISNIFSYHNSEDDLLKYKNISTNYIDGNNYFWSTDSNTGLQHLICYKKIKINNENNYIFVLTSLQSINEALVFISKYNIYMLVLAVAFIFLLSFLYSKMIASPLIRMNKAAKQMADLDFDVYCDIKTGDELESLSDSLNILSDNLQHSLAELQEANSALIEDIEREKEQERIRRDFVANISHELKTPLGIMKGFAEGIKDGIFENKKEYYLDVIIDEIEKMNILILDMLEVSALESKAYTLSEENFDINNLITKLNTRFDPLLKKHNLALELSLESNTVIGDKLKIEQVLMNLMSNAIRYSNSNETIRIKTISNKSYARISIENTGTHIPEADLPKIWDRFYRVEKSRNKSKGGSGLGLLIVKNILELHNYNYGMQNTVDGVEVFFEMKSK